MVTEYHALKELKLYELPSNSRLCWAACLQMFIHFRNPDNQIPTITDLVQEYKNGECYQDNEIGSVSNNIAINEDCLIPTYDKYGVSLTLKEDEISFEFIKNWLNENQTPILVGLELDNRNGHLVLISGYAKCEGTNYLLFFDPGNGGSMRFEKYEEETFKYQGIYEPLKYWLIRGSFEVLKLVKEDFLIEQLSWFAQKQEQHGFSLDFTLPIYNVDFINDLDVVELNTKSKYFHFVENYTGSFIDLVEMSYSFNSCELSTKPYIPSLTTPIGKFKDLIRLENQAVSKAHTLIFLNSHSVQALLDSSEYDKKMVFPIYAPEDYDLRNEWQSLEEFKKKFDSIKRPHTIIFSNKN